MTGSTHAWPVFRMTKPANDDGGGDRRVGAHVLERAAQVDVVLAAAGEEQGGDAVDRDPGQQRQ